MAGIKLTWAADFLRRIFDHLVPLRHPADRPGKREQHREHSRRETDRRKNDPRIEIDIGVELLVDKIGIIERDLLKPARNVEHRLGAAKLFKHFGSSLQIGSATGRERVCQYV